MATRIIDIARAASVSSATVSLVLNNKGNVSRDVRRRVRQLGRRAPPQVSALAVGLGTRLLPP
ncbi:MAG: LacI family DNA-binding transcriptional regulator, partial [Spirochaetales bacterium]|nr:LacI family DNA-binding transcriptional regulator [Spirochaetales bacterium]